jgi:hypothetical protein
MTPGESSSISSRLVPTLVLIGRFLIGLSLGLGLHYLLYRVTLPVQPFIYVAF